MLRRMTRLLRWPSLAGLLVFSAGTLDPHLSSLLGRSTTQQLHVETVSCGFLTAQRYTKPAEVDKSQQPITPAE